MVFSRWRFAAFLPVCLVLVAQPPLPKAADLKGPEGPTVLYRLETLPNSFQIYTCKATEPGKSFAWAGPDPDAIMMSADKKLTVHHYKGPTWEATDGSIVHGSKPVHFQATNAGAVDWLDLTASDGTKAFARITRIHRIETSGGVPPSSPCDQNHDAEQARIPYHATYVFYARQD